MTTPSIGFVFDRSWPAPAVLDVARRLDGVTGARLWLIEDCFYTAAQPLAAAALAVTEQLSIGLGILPAVLRNPAMAAMEIATLGQLGPGRLVAGIGHGVQDWMGQVGARPASPLTALTEVLDAVRALLAGEEVTADGEYVRLDAVRLEVPPEQPVPVVAGVRGPRSLAVAGRHADGVLLAEPAPAAYVRDALGHAEPAGDFLTCVYSPLCLLDDGAAARRTMAPWLAAMIEGANPGLQALPFADELVEVHRTAGVDGLAALPPERWRAVAPVGDAEDVAAHLADLSDAGADHVALFPAPDLAIGMQQVDQVVTVAELTG